MDTTADAKEAERLYGVTLFGKDALKDMDAVMIAVAHDEFADITRTEIESYFKADNKIKVLMDIKGILDRKSYLTEDYIYWRL